MRTAMWHRELMISYRIFHFCLYLTAGGVSASIHPTVSAVSICNSKKLWTGGATSSAIRRATVNRHVIRDVEAPHSTRKERARGEGKLTQHCEILMIHCWSQTGERFAISRCSCATPMNRYPISSLIYDRRIVTTVRLDCLFLLSSLRFVHAACIRFYRWFKLAPVSFIRGVPTCAFYGTTRVRASKRPINFKDSGFLVIYSTLSLFVIKSCLH